MEIIYKNEIINEKEYEVAYFNGLRFRKDKGKYYVNFDTMQRLHVAVWEYFNGPKPKKYHIHHKDNNKKNNDISNLQLLSSSEHGKLHYQEKTEEEKAKIKEGHYKNCILVAAEIHREQPLTDEHKKKISDGFKKGLFYKHTCIFCKKEFETKNKTCKYCCGKCKNDDNKAFRNDKSNWKEVECSKCNKKYFSCKKLQDEVIICGLCSRRNKNDKN